MPMMLARLFVKATAAPARAFRLLEVLVVIQADREHEARVRRWARGAWTSLRRNEASASALAAFLDPGKAGASRRVFMVGGCARRGVEVDDVLAGDDAGAGGLALRTSRGASILRRRRFEVRRLPTPPTGGRKARAGSARRDWSGRPSPGSGPISVAAAATSPFQLQHQARGRVQPGDDGVVGVGAARFARALEGALESGAIELDLVASCGRASAVTPASRKARSMGPREECAIGSTEPRPSEVTRSPVRCQCTTVGPRLLQTESRAVKPVCATSAGRARSVGWTGSRRRIAARPRRSASGPKS